MTTVSGCFVWTVIFLYMRLYTPVRGVLAHDRLNSQPKRLASLDTGIKVITTTKSLSFMFMIMYKNKIQTYPQLLKIKVVRETCRY